MLDGDCHHRIATVIERIVIMITAEKKAEIKLQFKQYYDFFKKKKLNLRIFFILPSKWSVVCKQELGSIKPVNGVQVLVFIGKREMDLWQFVSKPEEVFDAFFSTMTSNGLLRKACDNSDNMDVYLCTDVFYGSILSENEFSL
jgi:hypothetical protein